MKKGSWAKHVSEKRGKSPAVPLRCQKIGILRKKIEANRQRPNLVRGGEDRRKGDAVAAYINQVVINRVQLSRGKEESPR